MASRVSSGPPVLPLLVVGSASFDAPRTEPAQLAYLGLGGESALHTLADVLPHAVFTTDLQGRITFWNPMAERLTGWTRQEALGQDCSILAGDSVHGCVCADGPLRCGLAANGRSSKCCVARTKSGEALVIVKNAVPLTALDGRVIGALECFTDARGAVNVASAAAREGSRSSDTADFFGLIGRAPAMLELYRTIELVAHSPSTVLVVGESGCGKERIAEAIHALSPRARGPFVRVSCAALNENLLESELFGHVKGAFTGAIRDRRGRFEEAQGGTLLLDEIGDISPLVQLKLLRVIEQREVERVGDSTPIPVDVRLVCATHRELKALVADGRFRADLYFRLAVFPLRIPPLRERTSDLPRLCAHVLGRMSGLGRAPTLSAQTTEVLARYPWPGNVRELQNALEYAVLRSAGGVIEPRHLPEDLGIAATVEAAFASASPQTPGPDTLRELLERHGWNRTAAARTLGVSRVTLWKRLKQHGLQGPR